MNVELLREGARAFGLELDDAAIERFGRYMAELVRWNRTINLTAITRPDQIVGKHFVDCLSLVPLLEPGERLLDIGSGAGLPGLVVALVRPDHAITTLDAVEKKVRFQRHVCRMLVLERVEVLHGRVEQLALQRSGAYNLVTSRAFRDIERFVQLAVPLVRPGGRLIAMTAGDGVAAEQLIDQLGARYGLEHLQSIRYRLPLGMGERALQVMRRNQL